jgi:hypothetical protein
MAPGATRWAAMRRAITLILLVAVASIAMLASAPPAKADNPICDFWSVIYNNNERGRLAGCIGAGYDYNARVPFVSGRVDVCDFVNEPQETNIVRAQVMAAFTNGSSWSYGNSPWYYAPGDGTGCTARPYSLHIRGPVGVWSAEYVRITVEAPGKTTAVYRPGF